MFSIEDQVIIINHPPQDKLIPPGWAPQMDVLCGEIGVVSSISPLLLSGVLVTGDNFTSLSGIGSWYFHPDWISLFSITSPILPPINRGLDLLRDSSDNGYWDYLRNH